jgi:GTP cyclohydrolase I
VVDSLNVDPIEGPIEQILELLGADPAAEDFVGTPRRFAAYLREHFPQAGVVEQQVVSFAEATFPASYKGMVFVDDIHADGMCPHHLLPVRYTITIAYIPKAKVVGLSKLPRIAEVIARQALLQEEITERIASTLTKLLDTSHVAVVIKGIHSCMSVRGVRQTVPVSTSDVRGDFLDDGTTKQEFFAMRSA